MKHTSIRLNTPCELINITPLNPLISKCQIKVCYVGDEPNRNKSVITKDVARELANSLPGSPIVGYYNEESQDFEGHNRALAIENGQIIMKDTTRPYGFVDLNAKVWFQKFLDDGQFEREYLVTEGWLWTGQYPECKRVLSQGNNQSMELDKDFTKGNWTKDTNGVSQFFIINEAIMSKLCILGEETEPCFEGADIKSPELKFSFEESFKEQLFSMINEIKEILDKGGAPVDNAMKDPVVQDDVILDQEPAPVVEEPVVADPVVTNNLAPATDEPTEFDKDDDKEVCPECGKPLDECKCKPEQEDKKDKYVLEEIPEYTELLAKYSTLQSEYDSLVTEKEQLVQTNASLTEFKNKTEKKEKEAMIESFYMLSDIDKKDVIEHIDEYSVEDIEAKLSVICVRNKVSFDLDDDNKDDKTDPIVYNLNSGDLADEATPAWIKSLQSVAKNMQ